MRLLLALPVLLIPACIPVTVNLTFSFPPKEMEQKLVDMEKKVREEERPKSPAAAFDPVPQGLQEPPSPTFVALHGLAGFGAQDPNINVETPAIKEINERRKKRAGDIKGHFAAGRLGEGKDAHLAEREAGDLGGKEKAAFRKLMKEENEDRTSLLKEILKANKLADDQLDEVQHVYARALMKVAELGWWLETPSGKWVKKTEEHQKLLDKGKAIE
jgi:uncharacterized protein YdbL (DUF1318 family)